VRKNTSRDILSRWRPEVEARVLPGVEGRAMFSFGVGDAAPGQESGTTRVPLEETGANARSVLTDCLDTCGLLMVGPPPVLDEAFRERVARVAATLESVCREAGVGYLDIFGPLNSGRNYLKDLEAGDGIHPGRPGYNMIAELVWDWKAWQDWMAEIEN
jgi:lysophospholipase L1-like esterase